MIPIGNATRHLDDLGYSVNVEIYENLVCVAVWKSLTYRNHEHLFNDYMRL